jgi:hypothetical protein
MRQGVSSTELSIEPGMLRLEFFQPGDHEFLPFRKETLIEVVQVNRPSVQFMGFTEHGTIRLRISAEDLNRVLLERSTNLLDWDFWPLPIDGSSEREVPATLDVGAEFFRIRE